MWSAWTNVTATGISTRVRDDAAATHRWYRVSAQAD
jgi:hypothetical protein